MQNVFSSALSVTCVHSHNPSKINVILDIFIELFRIFLQGDKCVYVMENGSKIKIVKLTEKVVSGQEPVISYWLSVIRVPR